MRIFPKKHFTWWEPKQFLVILDERDRSNRRWWHGPALSAAFFAMLWFNWFLAGFDPGKKRPSYLFEVLAAIFLGAFVIYFMPWLTTKLPSRITVFDKWIVRSRSTNRQIRFKDIESFSWGSTSEFFTLILNHRRGKQIFVGVPRDIDTDAVSTFLEARGLRGEAGASG